MNGLRLAIKLEGHEARSRGQGNKIDALRLANDDDEEEA
jgi:hypothetical protein